jgi:hypothetical protein
MGALFTFETGGCGILAGRAVAAWREGDLLRFTPPGLLSLTMGALLGTAFSLFFNSDSCGKKMLERKVREAMTRPGKERGISLLGNSARPLKSQTLTMAQKIDALFFEHCESPPEQHDSLRHSE